MDSVAKLPDGVDALKAIIIAKEGQIARLEYLVKAFKQVLFGRKSEKLDPDQFELVLEGIETVIAETEAERDAGDETPKPVEKKPHTSNRGALPKHPPCIEEMIEPKSTARSCGGDLHMVGEDVTERLDVIPAQLRVIVTR